MNSRTFPNCYRDILQIIMSEGVIERNARTGRDISISPYPLSFGIDLDNGLIPVSGNRLLRPRVAAAEVAWFVSGERRLEWLEKYAKIWSKFAEPDGTVEGAYGYRWRRHFGRDQLRLAVSALQKDPSDRRVFVSAWDPAFDGLGKAGQRNVPCPVGFTLSIAGGRLNSVNLIRSSDVFVGLPYDVMGHALLMDAVSAELGVPLGFMHVTLAHPHIYDAHWEMARKSIAGLWSVRGPALPRWPLSRIESDLDGYVADVKVSESDTNWPTWDPRPELVV